MDLIEIDIVHLQPLQAGVDGLHDMLARQAHAIGTGIHREEQFGGDHHIVAIAMRFDGPAQNFLAHARGIDIGRIEEINAQINGLAQQRLRGFVLQHPGPPFAGAIGHAAEADF